VLAAPGWLARLALHTGAVDRVLVTESEGPVRLDRPALAVNLHGRGPQSHRRLLATAPKALIAFRHPDVPESARGPRWRPGEHEVGRWCRLLAESGMPADPTRLELDPSGLPAAPPGARGATLIHPGAKDPARRWPAPRWATVARREAALGRTVIVTAGPGEEAIAARVAAGAGSVWAHGDLMQLAGLVAVAGRVLSGDTGVGHLATALARPSVVLFGPVSPAQWGPPPGPLHRTLWAGRHGDPHGRRPHVGLLEIHPEDVVRAAETIPQFTR